MHYIFICRREPFWVYTPLARNVIMNFQAKRSNPPYKFTVIRSTTTRGYWISNVKNERLEREFWLIELRNFQLSGDFSWRSNTQSLCFDAPQAHQPRKTRCTSTSQDFYESSTLCILSFIAFFIFMTVVVLTKCIFLLVSESKKSRKNDAFCFKHN